MEQVFEKAGNFAQQYLPDILKFGLKVILCIAVYFIGKKVIDQIVRVLKRAWSGPEYRQGSLPLRPL